MRVGGAIHLQTIIMFFLNLYINVIEEQNAEVSDYLSSRLITQIASLPLTNEARIMLTINILARRVRPRNIYECIFKNLPPDFVDYFETKGLSF